MEPVDEISEKDVMLSLYVEAYEQSEEYIDPYHLPPQVAKIPLGLEGFKETFQDVRERRELYDQVDVAEDLLIKYSHHRKQAAKVNVGVRPVLPTDYEFLLRLRPCSSRSSYSDQVSDDSVRIRITAALKLDDEYVVIMGGGVRIMAYRLKQEGVLFNYSLPPTKDDEKLYCSHVFQEDEGNAILAVGTTSNRIIIFEMSSKKCTLLCVLASELSESEFVLADIQVCGEFVFGLDNSGMLSVWRYRSRDPDGWVLNPKRIYSQLIVNLPSNSFQGVLKLRMQYDPTMNILYVATSAVGIVAYVVNGDTVIKRSSTPISTHVHPSGVYDFVLVDKGVAISTAADGSWLAWQINSVQQSQQELPHDASSHPRLQRAFDAGKKPRSFCINGSCRLFGSELRRSNFKEQFLFTPRSEKRGKSRVSIGLDIFSLEGMDTPPKNGFSTFLRKPVSYIRFDGIEEDRVESVSVSKDMNIVVVGMSNNQVVIYSRYWQDPYM
ncbi:hypothetical protein PCE1_003536 [Barthelona sp. PCE]